MLYKTIVLELLKDRPALHDQLRASRTLLPTLETLAAELKARHDEWTQRYCEANPGWDRRQMAGEALAPAIEDILAGLPSESPADEEEMLSLDAAMSYIVRHTPTA